MAKLPMKFLRMFHIYEEEALLVFLVEKVEVSLIDYEECFSPYNTIIQEELDV